eukprot:8931833-Pyramimonas_sp.AAC.1
MSISAPETRTLQTSTLKMLIASRIPTGLFRSGAEGSCPFRGSAASRGELGEPPWARGSLDAPR